MMWNHLDNFGRGPNVSGAFVWNYLKSLRWFFWVPKGNWLKRWIRKYSKFYTQFLCLSRLHFVYTYNKTCVKWPLSKRPKIGFQDQLSLNAVQKYCRMLPSEHSAILSTCIKLPICHQDLRFVFFWVAVLHRFYFTYLNRVKETEIVILDLAQLKEVLAAWKYKQQLFVY